MPLARQNIPISFSQGLDTKTDYKQISPGRFLTLENWVFQTPKQLSKRNGYLSLTTNIIGGGAISSGNMLSSFGKDELVLADNSALYSYSPSLVAWEKKGFLKSFSLLNIPVIRTSNSQHVPDVAYDPVSKLEAFVSYDIVVGNLLYTIVDTNTGVQLVSTALLSAQATALSEGTAASARVLVFSGQFVFIYFDYNIGGLYYKTIPIASPTTPPSAPVTIDATATTGVMDAIVLGAQLFISYNFQTQTIVHNVYLDSGFVQHGPLNENITHFAYGLTIFADSVLNQIWCVYANGSVIGYFVFDTTLTQVLAPTTILANVIAGPLIGNSIHLTGFASNGVGRMYFDFIGVVHQNSYIQTASITNTGVVGPTTYFNNGVSLGAKVALMDGVYYILGVFFDNTASTTGIQWTYFLFDQNQNIVARILYTLGGATNGGDSPGFLSQVVSRAPHTLNYAVLQANTFTTQDGIIYNDYGVTETTVGLVDLPNTYYKRELGNELHIGGALPQIYDGATVTEDNFNVYPAGNVLTPNGTGGSLSAGQYQYVFTYEWTDNQGNIIRSTPSLPYTVTTTTGSSQVGMGLTTLRLTSKSNVHINIYRTEVNGTIFYQVLDFNTPIINDPTVTVIAFTDNLSDTSLITRPLLYTTGGVVPNSAPPPYSVITTYRNRLLVVPYENPLSFWYTKEVVEGQPAEFSADFVQMVDALGGNITQLAALDDKLVITKEINIFYMAGEGPDATGANNDFTNVQLITTDVGCSVGKSLVQTPMGLMFKSLKGIYLLDRSLNVNYIGDAVEAFNSNSITSAQLMDEYNQIRLTLDNSTALVYDYYMKQWSVFTNISANDAIIYNDNFSFLTSVGVVNEETPGVYNDNGAFIRGRVVTGWLSFAELQGFERTRRFLYLGQWKSAHTLTINVSYDFSTSPNQIVAVPVLSDPGLYQYRVDFTRQKCESFKIEIVESQTGPSYGEGLSLSAFNLMVGVKIGSNKLNQPQIYS